MNLLKALSFFRPPLPPDDSADRVRHDQQNSDECKKHELVFFGGFSAAAFPSAARGGIAAFECKCDYRISQTRKKSSTLERTDQ